MARGAEAKTELFNKIMQVYPEAFWEDQGKILRVPMSEAGNRVEIKVSLTAAKSNMGGDNIPSAFGSESTPAPSNQSLDMTQEEKDNVAKMLKALNL